MGINGTQSNYHFLGIPYSTNIWMWEYMVVEIPTTRLVKYGI